MRGRVQIVRDIYSRFDKENGTYCLLLPRRSIDSFESQPIDPTLYPEFSLNVVSNSSQSSIGIAPILALSFDCTDAISDWVIEQSSPDIWEYFSLFPKLRLAVLVLSIMFKLHNWWIHFSAKK